MPASFIETRDPRFNRLIHGNAGLDKLWSGGRWAEGPAYFPAGKYLVWSDIPNDRLMRWDETSGHVSVFEQPCRNQNGHTVDREGRLLACEHRGRCVSRIEFEGSRTILADQLRRQETQFAQRRGGEIRRLDLVHRSLLRHRQRLRGRCRPVRDRRLQRLPHRPRVGRRHPGRGRHGQAQRPRLLARRGDPLRRRHRPHPRPGLHPEIRAYPVASNGTSLGNGADFVTCETGLFDGFRVDTDGNIWSSAGDGVHCFASDGTLIGKILIPEVVANVEFGGRKRNRLFICATTSLFSLYVNARGCGF